ncbi:Alpha-2,8-polysialyltransferase (POLYST) [compost metagenome]
MSKLTKLVTKPRLFWRDMLKKRGLVYDFPKVEAENLFILSNLGQLMQIQSLIRFEGLHNNYLVVLSTPANRSMPRSILAQADRNLFVKMRECVLPRSPNEVDIGKLTRIAALYRGLLSSTKATSLYLLSFERHYAVLAHLAQQRGLRLCLVEEGTGTYKMTDDGSNIAAVVPPRSAKARVAYALIRSFPIFAAIRPALGHVKAFDRAYVAFPRSLGNGFAVGHKERFFLHAGGMSTNARAHDLVEKYAIGRADTIYVNQRYPVDAALFSAVICEILMEIAAQQHTRIFVKFHPKDAPEIIKDFEAAISTHSETHDRIVIIHEADFLIEPAISIAQPRAVVGLASTALVYAPLVSPDTAVYSIGSWFVSRVRATSQAEANEAGCAMIEDHLRIVGRFPHVVDLHDAQELSTQGATDDGGAAAGVRPDDLSRMIANEQWHAITAASSVAAEDAARMLAWNIHRFSASAELGGVGAQNLPDSVRESPVYLTACQAFASARTGDDADALRHLAEVELSTTPDVWGELRLWQLKSASLRRLGRCAEAEAALNALAPGFQEDPLWLLEMSRIAAANGRWEKALCYFGWAFPQSVETMPESAARERLELLHRLGREEEVMRMCLQRGRSGLSPAFAKEAIAILRDDVLQALARGRLDMALRAYHDAQELLRINNLPDGLLAYEQAMLCETAGNLKGAVESAGQLLSSTRGQEQALAAGALALHCHVGLGDFAAAQRTFAQLAERGIAADDLLLLRVWVAAADGDWEAVVAGLEEKIADVGPFGSLSYRATLLLAEANRRLERFEPAQAALRQLERKGHADSLLHSEVMRLAGAQGRWPVVKRHAVTLYADSIAAMPLDLAVHFLNATEATETVDKIYQVVCTLRAAHPGEERFVRTELETVMQIGDRAGISLALEHGKRFASQHIWIRVRAMRLLGDIAGAYQLFCFGEAEPPANGSDWLLRAEVCYLYGDIAQAEYAYACAVRYYPTEVPASTLDRAIALRTVLALRGPSVESALNQPALASFHTDWHVARVVSESN